MGGKNEEWEKLEHLKVAGCSTIVKTKIKQNPNFSFNNYLSLVYKLSQIHFDNTFPGTNIPTSTKLLQFLSRIELSKGFNTF